MFEQIKNIKTEDNTTWSGKVFISFDIDWAIDEVLCDLLDLLEGYKIKATLFNTHQTDTLEKLGANFELGIHPNFNFLLNGDFRYGKSYREVIEYYKQIHPTAISVRSHSLVQSTILSQEFFEFGLRLESNHFIPFSSNIKIKPFRTSENRISYIPFTWIDSFHFREEFDKNVFKHLENDSFKNFVFHPIHVYLNTENFARYNDARPHFQDYKNLKKLINKNTYGARDFLKDILCNAV